MKILPVLNNKSLILAGGSYIITIMVRRFLVFFLFLGISVSAVAQQESPPQSASTQQQTKLVTAIEIKGNKSISSNTIVSKMKTRIGSPYQENVISDDLKRLYLLGFFSDIKIDTADYKDGIKVIVSVAERPIIERISFSGIRRITMKDEKTQRAIKIKGDAVSGLSQPR